MNIIRALRNNVFTRANSTLRRHYKVKEKNSGERKNLFAEAIHFLHRPWFVAHERLNKNYFFCLFTGLNCLKVVFTPQTQRPEKYFDY